MLQKCSKYNPKWKGECMNTYCFVIRWGKYENAMNHDSKFLIFAPSQDVAKNFCENWIATEMKLEKDEIARSGGKGNYWWSSHSIEEVNIEDFDNKVVNIKYLNE